MKVLLDECLPVRLKDYLPEFEVATVVDAGWKGFKNGKLLKLAEEYKFEALFTVDKNLNFQQNIKNYNLIIVVFDVVFIRLQDIIKLKPKLMDLIPEMRKGNVYVIK